MAIYRGAKGGLLAAMLILGATPAFAQVVSAGGNTRLATASKNPAVRYNTGVELLQQKDFQHAVLAFRDVLDIDQRNPNANYMMGVAYLGLNDFEQAGNYLRTAVRFNSKLFDAHIKLGWVEAKLGHADGAKEERAALVKLDKTCGGTCPDAAAITAGIALIDKTLADKPGAPN